MVRKINQLVESLLKGLSTWNTVECVQRIPYHGAGMPDSPLFCLKLDVFFHEIIPTFQERLGVFGPVQFLETSLSRNKDRFFLDRTPVHIEYKRVQAVEELVASLSSPPFVLYQETTYGLFRLEHGIPLHAKTGWIRDMKSQLETLPDSFWKFHQQNLLGRLEHILSDMASAVFNRDALFFQLSQARFLAATCEALFAFNRQFLPPPEEQKFQLTGLELLPAGFNGLFDSLLREEVGFDRDRRLGIARHLTEGLTSLGSP